MIIVDQKLAIMTCRDLKFYAFIVFVYTFNVGVKIYFVCPTHFRNVYFLDMRVFERKNSKMKEI